MDACEIHKDECLSGNAVDAGLPMRPIQDAIADSLDRWQWAQSQTGVTT